MANGSRSGPHLRDWAESFAQYAHDETTGVLKGRKTVTKVNTLMQRVLEFHDQAISDVRTRETGYACRAGCTWCCYLRVEVTPLEALYIAGFLRSTWSPGEISALHERLRTTNGLMEVTNSQEQAAAKHPCRFLANNECSIYPARPIVCRGYHSTSVEVCEAAFHNPRLAVPVYDYIYVTVGPTIAGLLSGLREMELESETLGLAEALCLVLDTPGIEERWLAGEAVFSTVRTPEWDAERGL